MQDLLRPYTRLNGALYTEAPSNSSPHRFHNLTGAAAEHVDDNLDIIKNNPESDESLSIYIRDYKCGALTEEEFVVLLNSWMKAAGLYGDKIIVVQ